MQEDGIMPQRYDKSYKKFAPVFIDELIMHKD